MSNPHHNIMNSLTQGAQFTIDFSGIHHSASVMSLEGSLLVAYVNDTTNTYIIDIDRGVVFDHLGQEGRIILNSRTFEQMVSDPSITTAELDERVWLAVIGEVPECRCLRCTQRHINILTDAVQNPPSGGGRDIIGICLYIMDIMVPMMIQRIVANINDIFINDLAQVLQDGPEGRLSQVLQDSMQDGPKRHAAKEEVVSALSSFVQPYDACTHTCDTCTICMEKFEDIETDTNNHVMVITCPGCDNSFCAGKHKSEVVDNDEESCLGFYRLMGDDNRCPICRMEVKEWKDDSAKKLPEKETKVVQRDYGSETTMAPLNYPISDAGWTGVMIFDINREILPIPEKDKKSRRKHKFPPIKEKPPYVVQLRHTSSHRMRHNRQLYGR